MLRLQLLLCIFATILLISENVKAQNQINSIFGSNDAMSNNQMPTKICDPTIEGSGRGCFECDRCNNSRVISQRAKGKRETIIKFANNDCQYIPLCCFSQSESRARTSTNCGTSNPEGLPRRARNHLREVLPGQFPWRTLIYSKANLLKPLCAGVYVDGSSRSVIAPASCLKHFEEGDLMVKFLKNSHGIQVRKINKHFDFNIETQTNDIAILKLDNKIPSWAQAACLDETKLRLSSSCITVSGDDRYINTIVPLQSDCDTHNNALTESQLCAITPKYDYVPETGEGLVCETEYVGNNMKYTVYGIKVKGVDNISIYTNITAFNNWLYHIFHQ